MPSISSQHLVRAVLRVQRMDLKARERLADEIHGKQPNLLYSVVVLHKLGASLQQTEVVLELLLVFYEAMKASGKAWPLISDEVQDRCMQRLCARVGFIEGRTHNLQVQASSQATTEHPEQALLAWTLGQFKDHGLLGIDTEVHKVLLLAALNLVECIADTAPASSDSRER